MDRTGPALVELQRQHSSDGRTGLTEGRMGRQTKTIIYRPLTYFGTAGTKGLSIWYPLIEKLLRKTPNIILGIRSISEIKCSKFLGVYTRKYINEEESLTLYHCFICNFLYIVIIYGEILINTLIQAADTTQPVSACHAMLVPCLKILEFLICREINMYTKGGKCTTYISMKFHMYLMLS